MPKSNSDLNDEQRKGERIRHMVERGGLSWTDARIADDIACHASHASCDTLMAIISTTPPHLLAFTQLTALKMLEVNVRYSLQILALHAAGAPEEVLRAMMEE